MTVLRLCAITVVLAQTSCGPPAIDGGFDSANPAAKMYAIENAARDGDHSAINDIIEQLNSDDPAVRFLAIGALQRLTGQTYGYHCYDPPEQRQVAIEEWVKASKSGLLEIQPAGSPTDHPTSPTSPSATPVALNRGVQGNGNG